jgi:hypothetical protein
VAKGFLTANLCAHSKYATRRIELLAVCRCRSPTRWDFRDRHHRANAESEGKVQAFGAAESLVTSPAGVLPSTIGRAGPPIAQAGGRFDFTFQPLSAISHAG